jgi:hypothetical protein
MVNAVEQWYIAYVGQNVDGFMNALADDLEAYNFNSYESSAVVSKADYHKGFLEWISKNRKGGYVISEIVAHGNWVGVSVQFLTQSLENGQQKMTAEIHLFQLDEEMKVRRAYFYETNLCAYPSCPCSW